MTLARLAPRPVPSGLRTVEAPTWLGIVVAVVAWVLVVSFSEPWGRLWGTGQDARCYWQASLTDPYLNSTWNDPIAYVYSPAFLQAMSPLIALPWQAFMALWTAIILVAARFMTGPRLLAAGLLFPFAAMDVAGGNIHILIGAAIVLGFRWPATWALVLLTKITPGIGLLWFAVRREWGHLAMALAATAAIAAVSLVTMPAAWRDWVDVLATNVSRGASGTWAAVPVPLIVRLPIAIAVVVWGARTDRRWTVPVASMLALPALWYGGLAMLLAVIPLRDRADQEPASVSPRAVPEPRTAMTTAPAPSTSAPAKKGPLSPTVDATSEPVAGPTIPAAYRGR